mmetsp:Transcript_106033/g.295981  ORF Transcript_106033/g.295981 Transcript_106033/m.295981 type:complete len:239 (+) Transcript_106033:759-1475(+)
MCRVLVVLELADQIPLVQVAARLAQRLASLVDLAPDRDGVHVLGFGGGVRIDDDGQQQVQQDQEHQQLERQEPEICKKPSYYHHLFNIEIAHEDAKTHHGRLPLGAELLHAGPEYDVRGPRENEEDQREDQEEVYQIDECTGDRLNDDVQAGVRPEGLEKLHQQDEGIEEQDLPYHRVLTLERIHLLVDRLNVRVQLGVGNDQLQLLGAPPGSVLKNGSVQLLDRQLRHCVLKVTGYR